LPYTFNAVPLDLNVNEKNLDNYINASYIDGPIKEESKLFIATQGPLKETIPSFWKMIFTHKIRLVIMLSSGLGEGEGRNTIYWPEDKENPLIFEENNLCVEFVDKAEIIENALILKKFKINKEFEIKQIHIICWPDHGMPKDQNLTNDIFETIMVIGGEYCNTVEIFDPLTNRWQMLPPLNVPRCNPLFFFDEPRGNMYVLFGIEGNYVNGNYIDSMEILDLTNIKAGWEKLNYQNRANMDLKCYLNIYKLNEELFLIYGGMEGRVSKRNVCLYNTVKNEVTKIGKELMEQIRKEAKNSRKLSSIVTTISKESIV
jgi:hypothetical protein